LSLDELPDATVGDPDRLCRAFSEHYQTPEILKFKNAKKIFLKKQGECQSVDDYIAEMRKLAQKINADEKLICYAVLTGLKNFLVPYVTQQNLQTADNLLVTARMAQVTAPAAPTANSYLSDRLADVQTEVKRLAQCWDKLVSAPVFEPHNTNDAQCRSPSPRRVIFAEANPRAVVAARQQRSWQQFCPEETHARCISAWFLPKTNDSTRKGQAPAVPEMRTSSARQSQPMSGD